MYFAHRDGTIASLDAITGAARTIGNIGAFPQTTMDYDPVQKILFVGDLSGRVHAIDPVRCETLFSTQAHREECTSIDVSPDGRRIVTSSTDGQVRLFDAANGEHMMTLHGMRLAAHDATFSPDGTTIIACGQQKHIHKWTTSNTRD